MKIDVHSHLVPEGCQQFVPGLEGMQSREHGVSVETNLPPQIFSVEAHLTDIAQRGLDMHVLSTPPHLFFNRLDAAQALSQCRRVNDAFAETVSQHPGQFIAIADLPMQSPEDAARELERAVRDLGLRGAEICTNVAGRNLDEPALAPVWAKAQELDVPIFLHPAGFSPERMPRYYLDNLIGFPMDTTVAVASLIFGGVLQEFPRLKFYLAHGGGTCPYLRGRWEHGWRVRPEARVHIQRPPSEYFGLLYFDSLCHSVPALQFLVEQAGADHLMLGTDYPFGVQDPDPVKTVQSLRLTNAEKDLIFGGVAQQLFRI